MIYKEVEGDLIRLAKSGSFDVIAHGCNCFCTMGAGIAPQMAKAFGVDHYHKEGPTWKGNIEKLGNIVSGTSLIDLNKYSVVSEKIDRVEIIKNPMSYKKITIINCYTQYNYGMNHEDGSDKPFDYEAFDLCMRKINHIFKGKHIGLPQIGCGLAGGDWDIVKRMIQRRLKDMDVTIVIYKK